MTITERLFDIANQKGIRQAEIANALGIKAQLVNNWKTRGTTPPMEYLPTICETLGVSWEYLVTGKEANTDPRLTVDEEHLLKNYRKTNDKGRGRIQETAKEMVKLYPDISYKKGYVSNMLFEIEQLANQNVALTEAALRIHKPNTEVAKRFNVAHNEE